MISVAPDAIHHHIKTHRENMKNMHFVAPEYGSKYRFYTDFKFHKCGLKKKSRKCICNIFQMKIVSKIYYKSSK